MRFTDPKSPGQGLEVLERGEARVLLLLSPLLRFVRPRPVPKIAQLAPMEDMRVLQPALRQAQGL